MKCKLNPNLQSLSGKAGNLLFKTYTKPDGTKVTRCYTMPRKKDGSFGYERKTPVSDAELKNRELFKKACASNKDLTPEELDFYKNCFHVDKGVYRGKKYASFRGYLLAVAYNTIKEKEQTKSVHSRD